MTSANFRVKAVLGLVLAASGLCAASVRFGSTAQAGQQKAAPGDPKMTAQAAPNAEVWHIEGVVVDEQGRPVAGATVRTMPVV